jgi:hypothetical protein
MTRKTKTIAKGSFRLEYIFILPRISNTVLNKIKKLFPKSLRRDPICIIYWKSKFPFSNNFHQNLLYRIAAVPKKYTQRWNFIWNFYFRALFLNIQLILIFIFIACTEEIYAISKLNFDWKVNNMPFSIWCKKFCYQL